MHRRLAVLLFLGCIKGLMPSPAFASSDCMDGLQAALIAGGYGGYAGCELDKFEIHKLVPKNGGSFPFTVYDLIYQTIPQFVGAQSHGGERLLIFKDGKYLGQYALSPPPFSDPIIVGDDIVLEAAPKKWGNVIHFTKNEPPSKAWLQGYIDDFEK